MFAFAASFLSAGTACHLERLICIVGTDPGLCSHPRVLIATSTSVSVSSVSCEGTVSLWHYMISLILSALQVRLSRLQLRVGNRLDGGREVPQTFTTCISLHSVSSPEPHRIAHDACCLWLLIDCNIPFAIPGRRDSQTFTSCSSAVHVCDRELLQSGCLLYVLWPGILYLRCRLDVLHNWLRCLDHYQSFLNCMQLLVLTEMILHSRSKGHFDTETCSCL